MTRRPLLIAAAAATLGAAAWLAIPLAADAGRYWISAALTGAVCLSAAVAMLAAVAWCDGLETNHLEREKEK